MKPLGVKILLLISYVRLAISLIDFVVALFCGTILFSAFGLFAKMGGVESYGSVFGVLFLVILTITLPSIILLLAIKKRKYIFTIIMLILFILLSANIVWRIVSIIMLVIALFDSQSKMYLKSSI